MKILGFNGSPRTSWNTATLLKKGLEGAASQGAETELIHLYDLDFRGCVSCFACKTKGGQSYGKCAEKDELSPVLEEVERADAILLGSPIYFGAVTGEMRSFMERLLFPYLTYTNPPQSIFPQKIPTGFIYTMNVSEERLEAFGGQHVAINNMIMKMIFGASETLLSFDTYQFEDYGRVVSDLFDPEKKARRRVEVFPLDCEKAFQMGVKLTQKL